MEKIPESLTITKASEIYAQIPEVSMETGNFKYIYIRVTFPELGEDLYFVRQKQLAYHMYIYEAFQEEFEQKGKKIKIENSENENILSFKSYQMECLGGGRIDYDDKNKKIKIFGYSEAFGKANHSEAVKNIQKHYPDYQIEQ